MLFAVNSITVPLLFVERSRYVAFDWAPDLNYCVGAGAGVGVAEGGRVEENHILYER